MRRATSVLILLGTCLLFGLTAWLGMTLTAGFGRIAPIWFANGFVVAAMLITRRNAALWAGLPAGAFATNVLLNLFYLRDPPAFALAIASANTLEILIAAYGLRGVRSPSRELLQFKFVARFFLIGTMFAPCASALLAACVINIERGTPVLEVMRLWIPADALGMAIVVPLMLALRPRELFTKLRRGPWLAIALSQLILLSATIAVFSQTQYPLLFLLLPPLLLVIFQLGFNGAALAISTIAAVAIIATLQGHGPLMLVAQASMAERVYLLQLLLGSLIVTTYPVCAVLARHRSLVRTAQRHVRALSASKATVSALNEQMRLAAGAASIGFCSWDFTTNGIVWDPQVYKMFHLDPDLGPGKYDAWRNRLHPQDLAHTEQALQQTLAHGTELDLDFRVVWPDGTEREIRSRGVIQRDAGGVARKLVGLNIDMTELRRVDRMKSEFVSIVSHELRTPLTSIRGALGLLAQDSLPAHKRAEFVQLANRNAERLSILIDDLLDMEKIESGKMRFNLQRQSVGELMAQAIEANSGYAARYQVRLRLRNEAPGAHVCVDANRLLQVMANLLSNAAKFSPPGATVDISVVEQHRSVRIAVRDYGPGIPGEFQSRIFGKFCQGDGSDTRQKGGSGLGLAISKALVERMDGAISFITGANLGTTFFVDLPLVEDKLDQTLTTGEFELRIGLR